MEAYRGDGFVVVRQLVPAAVLDAAEAGMARWYAGERDAPAPGRTMYDHADWVPEHGDGLRKNDYTSLQVAELFALVATPALSAAAAALAGAPSIRLWHDQLLFKPPAAGAAANVGWHTDRQYWMGCSSEEMLTAWVPFHDCDEVCGSISFLAGSHRWATVALDFFDGDLDALRARLPEGGRGAEVVTPHLQRGDVTFHHSRTVHGSGPNTSCAPRRSMAIHLQPGGNRRVAGAVDLAGAPAYHRNDELVRRRAGIPDYADERVCPQLHPAVVAPHAPRSGARNASDASA